MPPKRGKGRGRGAPRQEPQPPPVGAAASLPPAAATYPLPRSQETVDMPKRPVEQVSSHKVQEQPLASLEALGLHLEPADRSNTPLARRPDDGGTLGEKISLIVNYFPLEIPSGFVYHYDVDIVSIRDHPGSEGGASGGQADKKYRCMNTKRNRDVINAMLKANSQFQRQKPAYDGRKNLYTKRPLDGVPYKLTVVLDDGIPSKEGKPAPRPDVFQVSVKAVQKKETNSCAISLDPLHELFKGKINCVPQEAVMAVETILRNGPCFRYVPVGRNFFARSFDGLQTLGSGRDIWFGYHQSLHLGQWKAMVNINMTATTFYKEGPVIDFICDFLNCSQADLYKTPQMKDIERMKLTKEMKNLRIKVTHLSYPRKYRIVKLTQYSANRLTFETKEGDRTVKKKVSDYFLQQYKLKLQFPHLPCLQVAPEAKNIFLPLEVCNILDEQHCKKKLTEKQTSIMIKAASIPPKERFKKIEEIVHNARFNEDPYNKEFGLRINEKPMRVDGRIINPPNLCFDKMLKIMPRDGCWDMKDKQFLVGADIKTWVLLSFAERKYCGDRELDTFSNMLCSVGRSCGIRLNKPELVHIFEGRRPTMQSILGDVKQKYQAELAVIVIPAFNAMIYGEIKQIAETVLSLKTQCVKHSNVMKCTRALVSNLCQKINAKMGGVNNSLVKGETPQILQKPVIIIGADVTHPGPSSDIKPSLAAVVGSLDSHPSRYAVTIRAQKHAKENKQALEIIVDLQEMVRELLLAFYRNTRSLKPEKIIFYRDGVSEGQFGTVRDAEISAVRKACRSLSADYQPGITFIVVQKRHHTRFLPQEHRQGVGKMRNIPPGTTVDQTVTHPLNFDFFLCSHFGMQGTSRPSHYTVLSDDNNFTSDNLQKLTYYLCHTYVRCTKSISVPAPVQYAHLAAFRARQHLISQVDESSASSGDTSTIQELPQNVIEAIKVKDDLKNTMYFV